MKLFDYETYEDYGKEWFLQVLQFYPHFALFDFTLQWDEYGGNELFPIIFFSIGNRSLFGVSIRYKKFYFDVDVIVSDPRDLEWYKKENHTLTKHQDIDLVTLEQPSQEFTKTDLDAL